MRADRKFVKLYLKDIDVIEGLKDYSIIHTNGDKTITAMNLKTIESQLPPDLFVRVNKSYIVNKNHILIIHRESKFKDNLQKYRKIINKIGYKKIQSIFSTYKFKDINLAIRDFKNGSVIRPLIEF